MCAFLLQTRPDATVEVQISEDMQVLCYGLHVLFVMGAMSQRLGSRPKGKTSSVSDVMQLGTLRS
jgi:hypothetical protein